MIHVCRLDVGSRHVFDSADGINEVGSLANAVEHYFGIEKQKQVLLISGGEILNDYTQKLYRLSAGREESPIYLIDQTNVEKDHPPTIDMPLDSLTQDMKKEIEAAISLKPSYQTLQTRSQLATRVLELGKSLHKLCQSFYDDQYWQYQGFLALIANLDEFFSSFCKRKEVINEQFEKYLSSREYNKELMRDIDKYIELLSNIRILPQIMSQIHSDNLESTTDKLPVNTPPNPNENLFSNFSSQSIADLQALQINEQQLKMNSSSCLTLLEWIKSTDPQNKLDSVIIETREMLSHFDNNFKWKNLQAKINTLVDQIENNPQMREIEGLTKRLQDLNNFLEMSKKFLASQSDIVGSLNANYERASKLKDESILLDLCYGHEKQLEVFKSNHTQMIEITRKISKAKLELIRVIHSRLNWVMKIQKQLADNDFQFQIYFKQLKRINARLKLMDHIKRAPIVYICSIKETIRRKKFSKTYKKFGELINTLVSRIYKDETVRRQSFENKICFSSQHFILNILFRSLSDKVEPFMDEVSFKFDNQLPQLEESEVIAVENELMSHLNSLRSSSFDSSTSSSSTSATSSSSSGQHLDNSSPMFESPQNSATKSSESQSSSKNSSKLNKFNEIFLNDLNLDEYKSDANDDHHLNLLSSLISFISENKLDKNSKLSNETNIKTCKQISEIRSKLSESKDILNSYFDEFKLEAKFIIDKQIELEKCILDKNEKVKYGESIVNSKFFSELISYMDSENADFQNKGSFDEFFKQTQSLDADKEFTAEFLSFMKKYDEKNQKKVEDLQSALNLAKTNVNADKQKMFNEAIKRATQEKDKIIEDLRLKEIGYIDRINELQRNLDEAMSYKDTIKSQLNTDVLKDANSSNELNSKIVSKKEDSLPVIPENETKANAEGDGESEDISQTKMKLRELMLMEKVTQLEKQLALFTTLPVTNDYETIQLNSCNIDDLVIAVYSEEYGSYKIIHKSSNYLHFVHSAIFKSHEQRLSFKSNSMKSSQIATSPTSESPLSAGIENPQVDLQFANPNDISVQTSCSSSIPMPNTASSNIAVSSSHENNETGFMPHSPLVKNSPSDNIQSIFLAEKQPQWFVGRVLVKEFCIARKENNRFRVPSGTRFYRVKLKPYNL